MGDAAVETALNVRAEHSEGPLWDGPSARLWWVDITAQRLHCFDPASGADCSWSTNGQPGGVLIDSTGGVIVAMPYGLARFDRERGTAATVVGVEFDRPENRLNDVKADSRGRIWAGSMAYDRRPDHAGLYRVEKGAVTAAVERLTISNGPAIDERSGRLYLADTARMIVDVFDLDVERGELSGRRRFLDVGDEQIWPDGMTVDHDGCLWLALGRGGAVRRFRPDGTLDGAVELPVTNPTSVAFGGDDGGDLYITSSWFDLAADQRADQPLAGAIFRCRPGATGPPSPRAAPIGEPARPPRASR